MNGDVVDFEMVVGDWGSGADILGGDGGEYPGGTPLYAGPSTFRSSGSKNLFSFGRLAMELMLDKPGTESNFNPFCLFLTILNLNVKFFLGSLSTPLKIQTFLNYFVKDCVHLSKLFRKQVKNLY